MKMIFGDKMSSARKMAAVVLLAAAAIYLCSASVCDAVERARLVFIGDVMAHEEQLKAAKNGAAYDFGPQFKRVLPLFYDALVTANLETVLAGESSKYTGYPAFNTPDSLAGALVDAGVHVVTLANNHILDRREAGLRRTLDVLDETPLKHLGASRAGERRYEPLIIEHEGIKIAMVNYTYGTNVPPSDAAQGGPRVNVISREAIAEGMKMAKALSPDLVVALFHWGNEYVYKPTKRDMETAEFCLDSGADMIIGTHPHVMQPIEVRRGPSGDAKLIAWSLGNFVSFQRTLPRERSVVLAVDLDRRDGRPAIKRVSVAPTWVSARTEGGRRRIETMYAGAGGPFNHSSMPKGEISRARAAGNAVLEFLGASAQPDEEGFYTVWCDEEPDKLPQSRRTKPM